MKPCFNEMTVMKNGSLPANITLCSQAGFHNIELRKGNVIKYLRKGGSLRQLRALLEQENINSVSMNALENITFQSKTSMRMVKELSDWCFSFCRELGCDCMEVIASFGVSDKTDREICNETVQALLQLSDIAANYGIRLALEFMAVPGSSVRSFDQCLEIIQAVDRSNIGMLLDTWHFYAAGAQPKDIFNISPAQLFMLHVSDCPKRTPGSAVRTESVWPGDGDIPLVDILRTLNAIGYDGICSIETMSPDIHELPANICIPRAFEHLERLMRRADVWEEPAIS